MKVDTKKAKKVYKLLGRSKRNSKKLSRKITLFYYRVTIFTFLRLLPKSIMKKILLLIPTITYNSIYKCPFARYYRFKSESNIKELIRFGYNYKKAVKDYDNITRQRLDKYGLEDDLIKSMVKDSNLILAKHEALKNPIKENKYRRMVQDYKQKDVEQPKLKEIAGKLTAYTKRNIDLEKESVDSVLNLYEAMKHGDKE